MVGKEDKLEIKFMRGEFSATDIIQCLFVKVSCRNGVGSRVLGGEPVKS